jgi:phosphatidylinositol alpha 1,6-mannosyltransferase
VKAGSLRVASFPDTYNEIDGVANTSRQFASFAKDNGFAFLLTHAGPRNEIVTQGSFTRIQVRRSRAKFPLDGSHEFDLLLLRHYWKIQRLVRDFKPDVIHITGPSDVGILGALLAHNLGIPLAASCQTNLHQFARCRVSKLLSRFPQTLSTKLAAAAESGTFRAMARYYKIPRLLFAPNRELVELLGKATGKPCFLMSHSVNTEIFSPAFRARSDSTFRIGYVGRLTPEKNVRVLAQVSRDLLARGHRDFRIVFVGEGSEEKWLKENVQHAEFSGVLVGEDLSRVFANMDAFVFPSETDTFGLAVLEALASGVPAVVAPLGGPKYSVEHGKSGYIANSLDEFASFLAILMTQPELHASMRMEARQYALSTNSWEQIFSGIYMKYEQCLHPAESTQGIHLDEARKIA